MVVGVAEGGAVVGAVGDDGEGAVSALVVGRGGGNVVGVLPDLCASAARRLGQAAPPDRAAVKAVVHPYGEGQVAVLAGRKGVEARKPAYVA